MMTVAFIGLACLLVIAVVVFMTERRLIFTGAHARKRTVERVESQGNTSRKPVFALAVAAGLLILSAALLLVPTITDLDSQRSTLAATYLAATRFGEADAHNDTNALFASIQRDLCEWTIDLAGPQEAEARERVGRVERDLTRALANGYLQEILRSYARERAFWRGKALLEQDIDDPRINHSTRQARKLMRLKEQLLDRQLKACERNAVDLRAWRMEATVGDDGQSVHWLQLFSIDPANTADTLTVNLFTGKRISYDDLGVQYHACSSGRQLSTGVKLVSVYGDADGDFGKLDGAGRQLRDYREFVLKFILDRGVTMGRENFTIAVGYSQQNWTTENPVSIIGFDPRDHQSPVKSVELRASCGTPFATICALEYYPESGDYVPVNSDQFVPEGLCSLAGCNFRNDDRAAASQGVALESPKDPVVLLFSLPPITTAAR